MNCWQSKQEINTNLQELLKLMRMLAEHYVSQQYVSLLRQMLLLKRLNERKNVTKSA